MVRLGDCRIGAGKEGYFEKVIIQSFTHIVPIRGNKKQKLDTLKFTRSGA